MHPPSSVELRASALASYDVVAVGRSVVDGDGSNRLLLCDPLTGLVSYPSFEEHLTRELSALARLGPHLAIGDVDDLKRFVTERRDSDPTMFGHLAGNACMRQVGEATLAWAEEELRGCPFAVCATFGGDEVNRRRRRARLRRLQAADRRAARPPRRPGAAPWRLRDDVDGHATAVVDQPAAYRRLMSHVDRALFTGKDELRARGADPRGELIDAGVVDLCPAAGEPRRPEDGT